MKPGCGAVITSYIGKNKITVIYSSDPVKAQKAREALARVLLEAEAENEAKKNKE